MWNQLFVLLFLGLFIGLSRFIPADARKPLPILDSASQNRVCEKDLGNGLKMVSVNRNRFSPCWDMEQRN